MGNLKSVCHGTGISFSIILTYNLREVKFIFFNIYGSVNAFIQVYNNTLSSGNKTDDASLNRYSRYLKSLSKEHSSELSRIGITVNSDGSLSANDNLLKSAKVSKVKTLFADDAEYITKVSRYSKKMAEKADSVVLSETLGSNIDLTL